MNRENHDPTVTWFSRVFIATVGAVAYYFLAIVAGAIYTGGPVANALGLLILLGGTTLGALALHRTRKWHRLW